MGLKRDCKAIIKKYDPHMREQAFYDAYKKEHPEYDPEGKDDPGAYAYPVGKFHSSDEVFEMAWRDWPELLDELVGVIRGYEVVPIPTLEDVKKLLVSVLPDDLEYESDGELEWHANTLIEELRKL